MATDTYPVGSTKSITLHAEGRDDAVIITARGGARELARELGFGVVDQTRIATAVSEIVRNVVLYAREGKVTLSVASREDGTIGMEIIVRDVGPGIPDVERLLQSGRTSGRGFGCGIRGSREMMDEFELLTQLGRGTTVRMCKWLD